MSQAPTKLGKYDIVRAIGNGAMGVVYEGFDTIIERTVAIKTIKKDELDPEDAEEHSRRFLIEAKAAGKLNHPNIVGIYDYGDEQGLAYIVMEFVQGKELKSYFDAKYNFNLGQTQRLMTELLEALGYSHHRGVIHRDVKPANVFVTDSGMVKLGDFGIARIDSSQKTHAGTVLGTPSYMSPEQIRGEVVDARSDLYSAGVILYQFLVGERPFSGNMVAIMQKVLTEPPPPPSSKNPAVSPALDSLMAKALAKNADDRFQSAAEFASGLAMAIKASAEDIDDESTVVMAPKKVRSTSSPADATGTGTSAALATNTGATSPSVRSTSAGTGTQGASSVDDLRRQAEDAKRRADEEVRRIEEQLRLAQAREDQEQREATEQFQQISQRVEAALSTLDTLGEQTQTLTGELVLAEGPILQQALQAHHQTLADEREALGQWLATGPRLSSEVEPQTRGLSARLTEAEQAVQALLTRLRANIESEAQALRERLRIEAEQRAEAERQRLEAERMAEEERQRQEAARRAEEERLRLEAEARAEAERQRLEAERQRLEAEQRAEAERLRQETLKREAQEKAEREAQEQQRREAEQRAAEQRAQAEAAKLAEEERLRKEAEARAQAERQEAERLAEETRAREQEQARQAQEKLEREAQEQRQRDAEAAQRKADEQRAAEKRAAEKRAEEQRVAEERAAEQRAREAAAKQAEQDRQREEALALKDKDAVDSNADATVHLAPGAGADATVKMKVPLAQTEAAPATKAPQRETPAAPATPSAPAVTKPAATKPVAPPATSPAKSSAGWMVPAGVGVLVLGVAAWWMTRQPEAPVAPATPDAAPATQTPVTQTPAPTQPAEQPADTPVPETPVAEQPTAPVAPPTEKPADKVKDKPADKPVEKPVVPATPTTKPVAEPKPAPYPAEPTPTPATKPVTPVPTPQVVSPTPKVTPVTPPAADDGDKPASPSELYRQGSALIREGRGREGLRMLEQAGNAGHGPASKRLMELYSGAEAGVPQDYGKAVKWKNKAKSQGMDINE